MSALENAEIGNSTAFPVMLSGGSVDGYARSAAIQSTLAITSSDDYDDVSGDRCHTYKFVWYLVAGLVSVGGLIGNTIAFFVFKRIKKKSSTFFLFQVGYNEVANCNTITLCVTSSYNIIQN